MATPSPRTLCWRCGGSDSCPRRFLLTCYTCDRSWHHRCHVPVVTDSELISRFNNKSVAQWRCRRCINNTNNLPPSKPIYIDLDSPPISVPSSPADPTLASPENVVVVIDLTTSESDELTMTLPEGHQGKLCPLTHFAMQAQGLEATKTEMQIPPIRRSLPDLVDSEWKRRALHRRSVRSPSRGPRKRAAAIAQQPRAMKLKCHCSVRNLVESIQSIRL